jgi:succinyl-diaminopimelate desuccinylase
VTDLLDLAAELVAVPSPSGAEGALAGRIAELLDGLDGLVVERLGDNVVARTDLGRPQRLLVAGHLDTVPAAGNEVPRLAGDVLWGLGAADMKGSLAVMVDLAGRLRRPAYDVTWCFYVCEEVSRDRSGLGQLFAGRPDLLAADAAVLGEPTACLVEAGCQGTMRLRVTMGGRRAHSARPFTGRNAIHRLAPVLSAVADWSGRTVDLDGCRYVEQLQAVAVAGGVAPNVIPDTASLTLNHRYAPDRDAAAARAALDQLLEPHLETEWDDRVELMEAADGAPPALGHPLLAALVAATGQSPRAKVGWTDVATFSARGIPAANFGPGDPLLAHHADERVDRAALVRSRDVLEALLSKDPPARL